MGVRIRMRMRANRMRVCLWLPKRDNFIVEAMNNKYFAARGGPMERY
jgi:hypothetical protein